MFKNFFSKRRKEAKSNKPNKVSYAPNTKIPYKPKLIPMLMGEHQALLSLYGEIIDAAKAGNSGLTKRKLGKFKDLFGGHLIKENVSLYTYLKHSIADEDTAEIVNSMKSEMYGIGKDVNAFLRLYTSEEGSIDSAFLKQFEAIGEALVRRIENEEDHLYPVYQPA